MNYIVLVYVKMPCFWLSSPTIQILSTNLIIVSLLIAFMYFHVNTCSILVQKDAKNEYLATKCVDSILKCLLNAKITFIVLYSFCSDISCNTTTCFWKTRYGLNFCCPHWSYAFHGVSRNCCVRISECFSIYFLFYLIWFPGMSSRLTPLQLETLLTEGNTSRFWLVSPHTFLRIFILENAQYVDLLPVNICKCLVSHFSWKFNLLSIGTHALFHESKSLSIKRHAPWTNFSIGRTILDLISSMMSNLLNELQLYKF